MAAKVGTLLVEIGADVARMQRDMGKVTQHVQQAAGQMKTAFAGVGTAIAGALSAQAVGAAAVSLWQAGKNAQGLEKSFKAIAGLRAGEELAFVRKTSDELGLSLYDAAAAYKSIAAAAMGTAMEGRVVRDVFRAVSEASVALSLSSEDTNAALLALSQMISKGKVSSEELRQQLGERLPGAFQIAARAMGMTTAELDKALEQGRILAQDLLPALARELHATYGQAAVESMDGAAAAENRMMTAWMDLKVAVADAGFLDLATAGIQKMTENADAAGYAIKRMTGEVVSLDAEIRKLERDLAILESGTGGEGSWQRRLAAKIPWLDGLPADNLRKRLEQERALLASDAEMVRRGQVQVEAYNARRQAMEAGPDYAGLYEQAKKDVSAKDLAERSAAAARSDYTPQDELAGWLAVQDVRRTRTRENLELERDFYAELGELTGDSEESQRAALMREYEVYSKVVTDKEALARWLAERELRISRDWSAGAILALRDVEDRHTNMADQIGGALTRAFDGASEALADFVVTGKADFESLADSIIRDLARIAVQQTITGPIAGALGAAMQGMFAPTANAKGNVYASPSLAAYEDQIVSRPTYFAFAKGGRVGVMGEAGEEAIMPLRRGPDGRLGVQAHGGGGPRSVRVEVHNESGERLRVSRSEASFDPQEVVVSLWLDAYARNKGGLRSALGG